jgi:hypothetical protein
VADFTSYSLPVGRSEIVSEAKLRVHFLLSLALKFEHRDFNQYNTLSIKMATPNELTNKHTRIQQAKEWLRTNPKETIVTAARIFKVNPASLSRSIQHNSVTS